MRYILNGDYIDEVSFGANIECKDQTCTEYTGTTPTGYDSLEEWAVAEADKLNAWKIVDGNLTYDANKYEELQALYETQEEENATATHTWVRSQLGRESDLILDEFSSMKENTSLILINDSGEFEIPAIGLTTSSTITGDIKLLVSNLNLLSNKATTTTISGVTITINADGTIKLDGTSSANIELTLDGSTTNTEMLFLIKNDIDYTISGLATGTTLGLYNYDGTDRTLINSGGNETINLQTSAIVTQSVLNIATGTTFDEVIISPMVEVGAEASTFMKHQENSVTLDLGDNQFTDEDGILIEYSDASLVKANGTQISLTMENALTSYNGISAIMNDKDLSMKVTYFSGKLIETNISNISSLDDRLSFSVTEVEEKLNNVNETMEALQSTMLTQTAEQFEMLFTQTGIENSVDAINNILTGDGDIVGKVNELQDYITFSGDGIEIGSKTSEASLKIAKDRISFMNGTNESAYITGNQLYITDSTILNKLQVGHWETKSDEYGNLNTRWVGGAI